MSHKIKRKIKAGDTISYWHSSSYIHSVTFIRWQRCRQNCGGEDSNKIGIGAVVQSDWLYSKLLCPKIKHGLKRGQNLLRPYWDLYRTYDEAMKRKNAIDRPHSSTRASDLL